MKMKNVTIKIASPRGHDVLELEPMAALSRLQELEKDGKWPYLDGVMVETRDLTIDQLINAETVLVANNLEGG